VTVSALTRVTRNGQITLPIGVRRALQIEEGDYLEVQVVKDALVLTPKKLIDKSQAYFWSQKWQAGEREADEDIAAGRVHNYADVEAAIAALHEDPPAEE
jgi:AbrB family looped-hinge helix DNA binding protein